LQGEREEGLVSSLRRQSLASGLGKKNRGGVMREKLTSRKGGAIRGAIALSSFVFMGKGFLQSRGGSQPLKKEETHDIGTATGGICLLERERISPLRSKDHPYQPKALRALEQRPQDMPVFSNDEDMRRNLSDGCWKRA